MSNQQTEAWPPLPLESWRDTSETFHLWTQIVGKIRLTQTPWINHTWNSTLYVTSRGLTTSPVPKVARVFPAGVCRRMVILGNKGYGHFSVIRQRFMSHIPNSYVVLAFNPLTTVLKKTPVLYAEFTSSMLPDASPAV